MQTTLRVVRQLDEIAPAQWDALAGAQPFLRHGFLHGLETTGCVGSGSGWQPMHLTAWRGSTLAAAMPLYVKDHSYGEFVFDWAWAEAYQRAGGDYYPKLLTAVPFTPVRGPRLLAIDQGARSDLLGHALSFAASAGVSSWHVLFPTVEEADLLRGRGLLLRDGMQFHWCNDGYRDFEDFLDSLVRDKRKKIRQERRRVAAAGVTVRAVLGAEIGPGDWAFFLRCYNRTYHLHRSLPYLNLAFFEHLGRTMPENLLLLIAEQAGERIGVALDVYDERSLYGRYWGSLEFVPGLHFEVCYYQGIEFCIERGLAYFEGGAQGEHKLARGLTPVRTVSAHWFAQPRFGSAVGQYLGRETAGVESYIDELDERAPFKRKLADREA